MEPGPQLHPKEQKWMWQLSNTPEDNHKKMKCSILLIIDLISNKKLQFQFDNRYHGGKLHKRLGSLSFLLTIH